MFQKKKRPESLIEMHQKSKKKKKVSVYCMINLQLFFSPCQVLCADMLAFVCGGVWGYLGAKGGALLSGKTTTLISGINKKRAVIRF